MTSYFRKFILNYARISRPLVNLITEGTGKKRDSTNIVSAWKDEHAAAFEALKGALTSEDMLAFPVLTKPFILTCDVSNEALGAVLTQQIDGCERPVEYASRILSPRESQYSATEREALAIVFAMRHFRHYIHGARFG